MKRLMYSAGFGTSRYEVLRGSAREIAEYIAKWNHSGANWEVEEL